MRSALTSSRVCRDASLGRRGHVVALPRGSPGCSFRGYRPEGGRLHGMQETQVQLLLAPPTWGCISMAELRVCTASTGVRPSPPPSCCVRPVDRTPDRYSGNRSLSLRRSSNKVHPANLAAGLRRQLAAVYLRHGSPTCPVRGIPAQRLRTADEPFNSVTGCHAPRAECTPAGPNGRQRSV